MLIKNSRVVLIQGLKGTKKLREEEETLNELLEDVQDRKEQQDDDMWRELEDYMDSRESESRRTNTLCTKIWQMTQGCATKTENLENDFIDLFKKNKRAWMV